MKKLAIAITSISALMATGVYADDANVSGDVKVSYGKAAVENTDASFNVESVTVGVKPSYETESGITAFGSAELGFEQAAESALAPLNLKSAFVGLGYMGTELTVGKQSYASDEFGIGKDKAFGAGNQLASTSGDEVVKVAYSIEDSVKVVASVDLSESEDESAIDVYGEYTVMDNITVAGTVQSHKANADADALMNVGVSGQYKTDAYTAGAEFTYNLDSEDMAYEVAASYNVLDNVTVAAGLGQTIYKAEGVDTLTAYYANAEYKVHENASAYAEVGSTSADNAELGYTVGMKVSF